LQDIAWERLVEAAPRLDRCPHDYELGAALRRDASDVLAEPPRPRADDLAPHSHAVRARHRFRGPEPLLEARQLSVEVRIQRQLQLEHGRSDENDAGAAVGREPAREIERVLGLLAVEQRHDDAAVGDRARPPREAPRTAMEEADVGQLHRKSWYGTEARITFGSTSSSRFT
jgi:hypothetical protein